MGLDTSSGQVRSLAPLPYGSGDVELVALPSNRLLAIGGLLETNSTVQVGGWVGVYTSAYSWLARQGVGSWVLWPPLMRAGVHWKFAEDRISCRGIQVLGWQRAFPAKVGCRCCWLPAWLAKKRLAACSMTQGARGNLPGSYLADFDCAVLCA